MEQKTLMFNLGLSILIPLLALGFNLKYHPPLRAANFIGLELFGPDAAFWTVEGSWRPNRDELGVAGVGNELALTRLGTKPKPVYRGRFQQGQTLQDLVWAPDGASIAFVEDGEVRVLRIGQKVPLNLGRGSSPCWSHDSRQIMFCQENERSVAIQTQNASRILHQLELYLADLADGSVEPYLRVYSTGTMWTWDSMLGQFYILDASGLIITWRNGSAGSAKLSGLDSGIFWHRLVPIPGRQGVFFLAVLAMTAVDSPYYTVGFYEFDAIEMRVSALRSIPRAKVTDVIIDAKTGNCLLGYSGIYRPIRLYEEKE